MLFRENHRANYNITIARAWRTPVLSFEEVKNRMNDIMVNEKLTAILSHTHGKFLRVWQTWVTYIQTSRFDNVLSIFSGAGPVDSSLLSSLFFSLFPYSLILIFSISFSSPYWICSMHPL